MLVDGRELGASRTPADGRESEYNTIRLDAEAGLAPMTSLGVVSDGVTSPQADPLGNGPVLLLGLGKLLLGTESLLARHLDCVVLLECRTVLLSD